MVKKLLTKEEVLERVSSYDIFIRYIGTEIKLGKTIVSPLRKESHPSFNLYKASNGQIYFKDFGGDSGSCFDFVSFLFNISFVEAINKVIFDFQLGESTIDRDIKRIEPVRTIRIIPEKPKAKYELTLNKWMSHSELAWWRNYKIGEFTLNYYKVFSAKSITIIRENEKDVLIRSSIKDPMYVYVYPSGRFKTYRPLGERRFKFMSNTNKDDIFGLEQLEKFYKLYKEDGDIFVLFICAGQKDCMALYDNTPFRGISLQSESCNLSNELYEKLIGMAEHLVVCYDNDEAGRKNSQKMNEEYGLPIFDIKSFTQENDIADYFANGGSRDIFTDKLMTMIREQKRFVL